MAARSDWWLVKCSGIGWGVTDELALPSADDIGEYCRRVEDHLTRANAGHLVRIVGPGFALVREWAMAGVPLSIVCRGIDDKAERHREGQAHRPLRIEFCENDIRALYDRWRRAIGLRSGTEVAEEEPEGTERRTEGAEKSESKRPSLTKHLDRAIDKLSRIGGRLELSVELRDACDHVLKSLVELRNSAAKVRGAAREEFAAQLAPLDEVLATAAREHAPGGFRAPIVSEAMADLAPYRTGWPPMSGSDRSTSPPIGCCATGWAFLCWICERHHRIGDRAAGGRRANARASRGRVVFVSARFPASACARVSNGQAGRPGLRRPSTCSRPVPIGACRPAIPLAAVRRLRIFTTTASAR
jgi:hypothetical protein